MDTFFFSRYYHLNKVLLIQIGVWPEQNLFIRIVLPALFMLPESVLLLQLLMRVIDVWGDFDKIMEPLPSCMLITAGTAMLINTGIKRSSTVELISRVEYAWKAVSEKPQLIEILERHASHSRKATIVHAALIYGPAMLFGILPITPLMLDIVSPLNVSRPKQYLFNAEYGCDQEKYYYWILFHSYVSTYTLVSIIIVIESTFSIWVQHCCALFDMTGYYLKHIADKLDSNFSSEAGMTSRNELAFSNLCFCIRQHQDAMVFASLIEKMYFMVNGYMTGMSILLISVTSVVIITQLDNVDQALRYGAMIFGLMYQLYHYSVFGQKLIDHSTRVSEYAYNCDWSELSPKEQKLLMLIIAQAQRPCSLTAGKLYTINMENFSSVVKTSVSYFTMLTSLR